MRVIILCPSNVQTGGPEALHQLSDTLIGYGVETTMWYTVDSDRQMIANFNGDRSKPFVIPLGKRPQLHSDYQRYRINIQDDIVIDNKTVIVFPETYLDWICFFPNRFAVIWWLSFDNCFRSLANSGLNLNSLRLPHYFHAYQSNYAKNILNALGFNNLYKLSDFTPIPLNNRKEKNKIAINAGSKVIFNSQNIATRIFEAAGYEVKLIRGLSRVEVYDLLAESFCYVDLGNFPGKDRMPREAALLDCIPLVLDVSGAKDYVLPQSCRFSYEQIKALPQVVQHIIKNYSTYLTTIEPFRSMIFLEEPDFNKEVLTFVNALNSRIYDQSINHSDIYSFC